MRSGTPDSRGTQSDHVCLAVTFSEHELIGQNFLALAASGYYDNTIFHRNIKTFMIQGGDPTGRPSRLTLHASMAHLQAPGRAGNQYGVVNFRMRLGRRYG